MTSWLLSLGSVGVVSLVSVAGLVTLSLNEVRARRLAALLVSFAVGALLGDAFIHLIPQAFEQDAFTLRPSLLILGGCCSSSCWRSSSGMSTACSTSTTIPR
jgi:zinc and cadmium transporter